MKNVVRPFSKLRRFEGYFHFRLYSELHAFRRHLPGASSRTPHPLAVPRLKLVVPRGRPRLSRTSMFGAAALSAAPKVHGLPLSKATRKSRVPAARSTGTCALSVSHARALRASASRVPRSSARHLSGGRASPRGPGASLVRRVRANKYPPMAVAKKAAFPAITPSHASASPPPHPDAGLRVRAMAAEEKSRIGLCGLAVMGQVRPSPQRRRPVRIGRTCVTAHRDYLTVSRAFSSRVWRAILKRRPSEEKFFFRRTRRALT